MQRSTDRILTTHAGGLERPPELSALLLARERGEPHDQSRFNRRVADAVAEIAERLESYAGVAGRENVIAGTDCGIGPRAGNPKICWPKFEAMAEAARIASRRLWGTRVPAKLPNRQEQE